MTSDVGLYPSPTLIDCHVTSPDFLYRTVLTTWGQKQFYINILPTYYVLLFIFTPPVFSSASFFFRKYNTIKLNGRTNGSQTVPDSLTG